MNRIIVAFTGRKGSGKDSAAQVLTSDYGFTQVNFADPVKELCADMFGIPVAEFHDVVLKNEKLEVWPYVTRRKLLQDFAEAMREKYPDIWVRYWLRELRDKRPARVVVSDLRYPNEFEALQDMDAHIFRIYRDKTDAVAAADTHKSESFFDIMSESSYVSKLRNNGTLLELQMSVHEFVRSRLKLTQDMPF